MDPLAANMQQGVPEGGVASSAARADDGGGQNKPWVSEGRRMVSRNQSFQVNVFLRSSLLRSPEKQQQQQQQNFNAVQLTRFRGNGGANAAAAAVSITAPTPGIGREDSVATVAGAAASQSAAAAAAAAAAVAGDYFNTFFGSDGGEGGRDDVTAAPGNASHSSSFNAGDRAGGITSGAGSNGDRISPDNILHRMLMSRSSPATGRSRSDAAAQKSADHSGPAHNAETSTETSASTGTSVAGSGAGFRGIVGGGGEEKSGDALHQQLTLPHALPVAREVASGGSNSTKQKLSVSFGVDTILQYEAPGNEKEEEPEGTPLSGPAHLDPHGNGGHHDNDANCNPSDGIQHPDRLATSSDAGLVVLGCGIFGSGSRSAKEAWLAAEQYRQNALDVSMAEMAEMLELSHEVSQSFAAS
jgi:hypothetical protein